MGKYKKEDLIQISYSEFGQTMDILTDHLARYFNDKSLDLIVPILRSGAFTALHLAARLDIKNILPVYYKYTYGKIDKMIEIPKLVHPLPASPNILIVDSCLTSGTTVKVVLHDLMELFPDAKFYGAASWLEEGIESIEGVEKLFWGKRTNENKLSTDPNCLKGLVVAPWESMELDWNEVKNY